VQALREYGAALHAADPEQVHGVLRSLLHMHHNRLVGVDPEFEQTVFAAYRGIAQVIRGRRRAGR
jgi:hypothetical protein